MRTTFLGLLIVAMLEVTAVAAQTRVGPYAEFVFTTPVVDAERRFGGRSAALGCTALFAVDSSWTWEISVGAVEKRCDIYRAFFAPAVEYARIILDYAELRIGAAWSYPVGPLQFCLAGGFSIATPFGAEAEWYERFPHDPPAEPVRAVDMFGATARIETAFTVGGSLLWPVTDMASVRAGYTRSIGFNEAIVAPSEDCQGCREGSYRTREDRLQVGLVFAL